MRWTLVSRAYNRIRQLVLNNARVMAMTQIQLPEINNTTLSQWYNRRAKKQERQVLQQGISLVPPPMISSQVLPSPSASQPSSIRSYRESHQFDLPDNTAGMANLRKKSLKQASPKSDYQQNASLSIPKTLASITKSQTVGLRLPDGSVRFLQLPGTLVDVTTTSACPTPTSLPVGPSTSPVPVPITPLAPSGKSAPLAPLPSEPLSIVPPAYPVSLPYSTYRNRKRKGEPVREYHRRTPIIKCGKCGEDRSGPDHCLYFMNVYCAKTDEVSLEAWKATMKTKYRNRKRYRQMDQD